MLKLKFIILGFLLFLTLVGNSQQKYRVYLTDKKGVTFNPYEYFDAKAIERRLMQGISLDNQTDYPLNPNYIAQISTIVDSVSFQSRWFNMASVYVSNEEQLQQLERLDFVKKIEKTTKFPSTLASLDYGIMIDADKLELLTKQTQRLGLNDFESKELDGKGLRIAVFDAGFPEVDMHPAFEHLRENNRIVKTYDFVKNKDFVYYGNAHGRMTLACIGGIYNGIKMGLATGAEFMLAKTEMGLEPFSEEEHWLAAAEWADKNGADIISSSLGYGYQRYFTSDMDGKTSFVVKAAHMAVSKGILVVNSAGNEGTESWKALITPADGDSVLAIGGIDPETDLRINFSSYGPTADNRLKPNVSAYGHVVSCSEFSLTFVDGTSFSAPLVSGFAACAWQSNRNLKVMEIFDEIQRSAHLYPYYDYSHGYGIPQAKYFTDHAYEITKFLPTFKIIEEEDLYRIRVIPENYNGIDWMKYNRYLFYHITDENGLIKQYFVIEVEKPDVLTLYKDNYQKGQTVKIHFRGNTQTINF